MRLSRRSFAAMLTAAPFGAASCDEGVEWQPINQADPRLIGVWQDASTGRQFTFGEDGPTTSHRLGDFWIIDVGLTPLFELCAFPADDVLLVQHYDYRATPELLQAPLVLTPAEPLRLDMRLQSSLRTESPRPEVFDIFCRTFERYYAFFAERGVDWAATQRAAEPRVAEARDDDALFDIFTDMLRPLGDGHVNLYRGERTFNAGRTALRERLNAFHTTLSDTGVSQQDYVTAWSRNARANAITLLDAGTHRTACMDALEWGLIGQSGYFRINRFSNFADAPRPAQIAALQAALADMERDLANAARVIVDVVHNGGGNDAAAMIVAQHFADRSRKVLEYRARGAPNQPIRLSPRGAGYARPVTLLTSEITASAAESFVLMMRAFPHVTHVGGRTRGILSSLLPKPFPNGFMATLAYQHVLDDQGRSYEARGIPPAREIELFPDGNLTGGYAEAIRMLAGE